MHKQRNRWSIIAFIIITTLIISSCELPFNLSKMLQPVSTLTQPEPVVIPPPVLPQETPPPVMATEEFAIVPVTGSILRWVDLSDFVYVPGGEFIMGEDTAQPSDHAPAHTVILEGFWIHQAEVTNQQYEFCVTEGKCTPPSKEPKTIYRYGSSTFANYPVVGVNWFQAQEYCTFIEARLPTEAEWEKAARGVEAKPYPWGEDTPTCDLLNFNDCLDPSEPENVRTYNNGTSPFEVMDMSGNVFEWVSDWFAPDYYPVSPANSPQGPERGTKKVFRGGSYQSLPDEIGVAQRFSIEPAKHAADLGFRCVLIGESPIPPPPPCEVIPINGQPEQQPTFTPFPPCPDPSINAFCRINKGSPLVGIEIRQADCYDNILECITANSLGMDCNFTAGNPSRYICSGSNLAQGALIDLFYCHLYPPLMIHIECPAGYTYNSISTFCEPDGAWLPDPPCPVGYTEYLDFGCLPDYWHGGCPVGYYTVVFGSTALCFPMDECLLPNPPESCNPPVCPEGETYDSARECCVKPEKLRQVCPTGFTYYPVKNICALTNQFPMPCNTTQVAVPYCPTPTPTPTSPPPNQNPCYSYNEDQCNTIGSNFCEWVPAAAFPGYCRPK